jgi:uncharacterized protein (TIGR02611 family)
MRRVGIFIAGWLVVVVGLVLVPLPGPGWVIVFVGLSLLATEFAWAARLKTWVQRQLAKWVDYAKARSWRRRGEQAAVPLVQDVPAPAEPSAADDVPAPHDERSVAS